MQYLFIYAFFLLYFFQAINSKAASDILCADFCYMMKYEAGF